MALTFDTGLPKPQRTMLFEAIRDRLMGVLGVSRGMYLRQVKRIARMVRPSVNDTHDAFGIALIQNASQGNFPCVLVAFGGAPQHPVGTDPIDGVAELEVQLLSVSSHLGGLEDGRLAPDSTAIADPMADPGLDTLLEHVEQLLKGQDLGVDTIYEPRFTNSGDEIDTLQEYSIWEQRFTVQLDRNVNPDRADTRQSLSIEVDAHLDGVTPGGELDPITTTVTDLEAP